MEIWKDIIWYEWMYQVSNLWNVKSLDRIIKNMKFNWKILKSNKLPNSYHIIDLRKWWLNTRKNFFIHRLVAQAFLWLDINNRKIVVCHKDDNPSNNCVDNLFLWTHKENTQDMISKWRDNYIWRWFWKWNWKTKTYLLENTKNILELYKKWFSYRKIANLFNVSHSVIWKVIKNK